MLRGLSRSWLSLAVLVGAALGLGLFCLEYAEGLSYLSDDPKACANCHIMNEQYEGWQKASHHAVATCNGCHVPHDPVGKYLAKAANGYHHSRAFTLQDFHEPIAITAHNAEILQANCLRCHGDLTHELVAGSTTARGAVSCVHCHRGVGHGSTD